MIKKIIGRLCPVLIIKKSLYFDAKWYHLMNHVPEKKAALHYLKQGYKSGCDPSPLFSGELYFKSNPDISDINPLLHYELYGKREKRQVVEPYLPASAINGEKRQQAMKVSQNDCSPNSKVNSFQKLIKDNSNQSIKLEQILKDELISIIIPTYNGGQYLQNLISSLKKQNKVHVEIICVDSGSKDGTIEYLESQSRVVHIPHDTFSHSYARNLGAHEAKGKYLLFMTQDVLPEDENWLFRFLESFIMNEAAAASCKQIARREHDLWGKYEVWGFNRCLGLLDNDLFYEINKEDFEHWENVRKKAQLNDTACIIRKDVFINNQYREEYAEDLDLGIRLLKNGEKLGFICTAKIIHSHQRSQYYYMKRTAIDVISLYNLAIHNHIYYPLWNIKQKEMVNGLLSLCLIVAIIAKKIMNTPISYHDKESYLEMIHALFDHALREAATISSIEFYNTIFEKDTIFENELSILYERIFIEQLDSFCFTPFFLNDFRHLLGNMLANFFEENKESFQLEQSEEIISFISKYMANMTGKIMAQSYIKYGKKHQGVIYDTVSSIIDKSGI